MIPSSTSLFPISELKAFEPILTSRLNRVFAPRSPLHLARFPSILSPLCFFFLFKFLYFLIILLAIFCVGVFARFIHAGILLTRLFLSPIVLRRLIVTFNGKFRLLTLLYLVKKDFPLGNSLRRRASLWCRTQYILSHRLLLLLPPIFFFK